MIVRTPSTAGCKLAWPALRGTLDTSSVPALDAACDDEPPTTLLDAPPDARVACQWTA